MASQVSETVVSCLKRDFAVYHPSLWPDKFLDHTSDYQTEDDSSIQEQHEALKQDVRRILLNNAHELSLKLKLIDTIQRLGIAYHFKTEIEDQLDIIFNSNNKGPNDNLHDAALCFRLLRQQGIRASCDVFENFKDDKGKFKEDIVDDVEGMLSLYEAAFLSIRGEDILDEAIAFTTRNLQLIIPKLTPNLAEKITHALNRPIRKNLPRLEARYFIHVYEQDKSHKKTLLTFAKLDFNLLQEQHQKELMLIIEWWKCLNVTMKLPYVRDRVVECYFWAMGVYFEPQYNVARMILTKVIAVTTILDDTYDNFATIHELQLLTKAIQRWEVDAIDTLPEYMKMILHTLNDVYNEIEEITTKEGKPFCVHYGKESMKRVVCNYLAEAKWREEKYTPTMEEYMKVALVTASYHMLATTSFLGMGEIVTKDVFEWIFGDCKIVKASSIVCRFMDDIVSHQFEQKREHVASGIDCCMKQYEQLSKEDIIKWFRQEIANAWKDVNKECLKPVPISMELLERVLNLTRVIDVIYKDDDGFTNSYVLKDLVASVLKDPLL